jgi:KinB signaling pathway activation protein
VKVGTINYWHPRMMKEESTLNFRKWGYLFFTTLLVGGVSALAAGLVLQIWEGIFHWFTLAVDVLIGLMFSVLSQMGFFAYLMLNYIALSIIKRPPMWKTVQVIFVVIVLIDLVVVRHLFFEESKGMAAYSVLPVLLLAASLVAAYFKSKATNHSAFVPTLFFLTVVTALEAIPALKMNDGFQTFFMIVPLFVCNTWQIMKLHQLVGKKKEPV